MQELLSSGENKYKNPEARLQREMSLQKKKKALCWKGSMFGLSYFSFAFWDFRIPVAGIAPR